MIYIFNILFKTQITRSPSPSLQEHLHLKRVYISTLRKIRSGSVYSLFQANNIYKKLHRLDRKLAIVRPSESEEDVDKSESGEKAEEKEEEKEKEK